ncbi:MAG TPA: L,D-transpeptidase family protein [Geothermobacteraceae bacterium]|nr:L,D-transpeptidase family protein [Geothermobacteraceae bacterium]
MFKPPAITLLTLLLTATSGQAWFPRLAEEMNFTSGTAIIGHNLDYIVGPGETLMEIARRAGIGFDNLLRANPGIDPWKPATGQRLLLPKAVLAPELIRPGITINLAELRLYLVWDEGDARKVRVYPVGIGREGWATPVGEYRVSVVIDNPDWTPPASLRLEKPELPGRVPAGPDNPLGSRWIGLTAEGVGIHGSNQPYGVGRRVSHGCIRLYPEDILDLAGRVKPGTPVRIVDQPLKQRLFAGRLYLEAHRPFNDPTAVMLPDGSWPAERIARVLTEARGLPIEIRPEQ